MALTRPLVAMVHAYNALVDLLLYLPGLVPLALHEGPLLLEEGRGTSPRLPHKPTQLTPLYPCQSAGLCVCVCACMHTDIYVNQLGHVYN